MDYVSYLNPFASPSAASNPQPPEPGREGEGESNYENALKAYQQRLNRVKKEPTTLSPMPTVPVTPSLPDRGELSPKDTIPPSSIGRNTNTSPQLMPKESALASTPLAVGGRLDAAFSPYSPMATPAAAATTAVAAAAAAAAAPSPPSAMPPRPATPSSGVDAFVLERRVAELERVNQRLVQDAADQVLAPAKSASVGCPSHHSTSLPRPRPHPSAISHPCLSTSASRRSAGRRS